MAMIIGLTGGIASGKSTVSAMLKAKGYTIVDADIAAREVVNIGEDAYYGIIEAFGKEILLEDGNIDRKKLGSIVFHNTEKRLLLNSIVHPAVRNYMQKKKAEAIEAGKQTIIMDIPLLFESKLTYMVDKTILVFVDPNIQKERLMKRNHLSEEDAIARIRSQMPLKEKIQLSDAVIDNNETLEETKKQLNKIINEWDMHP
ncbi:dephospho-CoA kinase [Heyndrickxia sporothermodurans]|uniref:Dephospho-CoA kinase n=1 Tax=Heyndrickxia sporothermodurans TaxID=46224 RepID=A0A150LEV6_9BACI|nr:dephospho-CoA kinase [Heyndrickxia sporothermodurans]KYD10804.1 Dephospho-CoA kinase [Heyndrickxia sporothermodurans]MBL5766301.1 dephospho-CoA kinase [Heyndrickxia sporothermodurans]MBL5769740.1 dephospho-CoA kinase [Heyndrickxia sporothermodurans]MBL5773441.1 dephospho-CoA kinase [Heyndrickxia sporothermodurans]MBL5777598.1 dephospho-CoA kinase [Heyndrickxia sporothermodurans]